MYKHYSQVTPGEIKGGELAPVTAQAIALCFDLDAFLDTELGSWVAFDSEDDDELFIPLEASTWARLCRVASGH
jgi:hypothetical protein